MRRISFSLLRRMWGDKRLEFGDPLNVYRTSLGWVPFEGLSGVRRIDWMELKASLRLWVLIGSVQSKLLPKTQSYYCESHIW